MTDREKVSLLLVSTTNRFSLNHFDPDRYDVQLICDSVGAFRAWEELHHTLIVIDGADDATGRAELLRSIKEADPFQRVLLLLDHPLLKCCGGLLDDSSGCFVVNSRDSASLETMCQQVLAQSGQTNLPRTESTFSNERLDSQIRAAIPMILVGIDPQLNIRFWNREAEKQTGVKASTALNHSLAELWPEFSYSEVIRDQLLINKPLSLTGIPCEIGRLEFVDLFFYPLPDHESIAAIIRIDDVATRVRNDERILQTEKMSALANLATGLAHEINNPLAGMTQNVQVVRNRLSEHPKSNRDVAEAVGLSLESLGEYLTRRNIGSRLDAIMESGVRVANIIETMVGFGHRGNASMKTVDVGDLIDMAVEQAVSSFPSFMPSFDFSQINIRRKYDSPSPQLHCNANQIQQVLFNLLVNGAFYMAEKEQGLATLNYRPCFVLRLKDEPTAVVIEIEDNGTGVAVEKQSQVFDPFFSVRRVGQSVGLGMAVSYFVVCENHQGDISVKSRLGEGSCFTIRLPKGHLD